MKSTPGNRIGDVRRVFTGVLLITVLWHGLPMPASAQSLESLLSAPGDATDGANTGSDSPAIDTTSSPAADAAIERRLRGIFSELDQLTTIDIQVTNGVVSLSGRVDSVASASKAIALARQVESVVEVVDETQVDTSVQRRLASTVERLQTTAVSLLTTLPLLFLALLVVILFWWVGKRLSAGGAPFRRFAPNAFIAQLLGSALRMLITLAGVVLALLLMDATSLIGTVLGAAGIVGLALGFAVRDTVENYIASILLSLRNPFKARDFVSIDGVEGSVARLTSRATILISLDGNHVRIPNAMVYKAVIINFTRNPHRRFDFVVGVDTDLALQPAQELALQTLGHVEGVLTEPPPVVIVEALGDSNVSIRIYCWINQHVSDFLKVRSEAIRLVKRAFDEAGIVMPEPIYRLRFPSSTTKDTLHSTLGELANDGRLAHRYSNTDPVASADAAVIVSADAESEYSADTSQHGSMHSTLEKEIRDNGDTNLLLDDAQQE